MKRISTLILVMMVLIFAMPVFAANETALEFTGEEIKLSLEGAKKMMLTSGAAIETANINMKRDKAKTRSYYENTEDLGAMAAPTYDSMGNVIAKGTRTSKSSRERADLAVEFAKAQTPRNYDAEVNQIVRDTVENYYKLAQVKESVRISEDNVAVQEKLYQNTQSKFKLGVVSKQDVLKAEIGFNEAKVSAEKTANSYSTLRMSFNISFGYDLMQNVTITDTLQETPVSEMPLDEAISKALENRNEIRGAEFALKVQELSVKDTGNSVSKSSARYLQELVSLMNAESTYVNMPKKIEMDVKTKYMTMVQKKSEVELGKLNVSNAKETYRLANLQYDAGMATLTDTQQAQLAAYKAELDYYSTLLDYNLSVIDYEQSATVGTNTIGF